MAHGQPAIALFGHGGARNGPAFRTLVGIGENRRVAIHHGQFYALHLGQIAQARRGHARSGPALGPFQIDAVVVQRQARQARIIARFGGQVVTDAGERGQGIRINQKAPRHPPKPAACQGGGHVAKAIGVKRGVAAARQDQVARQSARANSLCRQNLRGEVVVGAQPIQRIKCGDGFDHAGGGNLGIWLKAVEDFACGQIRHAKASGSGKIGFGHQVGGCGALGHRQRRGRKACPQACQDPAPC